MEFKPVPAFARMTLFRAAGLGWQLWIPAFAVMAAGRYAEVAKSVQPAA